MSAGSATGAGFWEIARAEPDRVAVVDAAGATTTYGDLLDRVDRMSAGLRSRGLSDGDHVACVMGNEPDLLALVLATAQVGLYLTPINHHLTEAEAGYIVGDSTARIVVAGEGHAELAGGAVAVAGLPAHCCIDAHALVRGQPAGAPPARRAGRTMLYTSGTTGHPKGVLRALPNVAPESDVVAWLATFTAPFGMVAGPGVHLVVAPLYHAAPQVFAVASLHLGHAVVLETGFDAERTLRLVERHGVTSTHMVPTMFHRLLALPAPVRSTYDLSSLRQVIHAAAPCPVETKRAMLDWLGPVVHEYYAATEGAATFVGPREWLEHPGTVGRAPDPSAVRILDDSGTELPAHEIGTVYLRPRERFVYQNAPAKTAAAWRGDHVTVGDIGYLDDDGRLYLCDRRSDLIITGGVNVYPAEVEAALHAHPGVADAAVIGLADPEWGRRVVAVVEPPPGTAPGQPFAEELIAHCRARLAAFKCPRAVEFVERLPRTPTGKLARHALRDRYEAPTGTGP